jgi:hypothetical protein
MKYNYENPIGNVSETENPIDPYEYPKTCVKYLIDLEFKQWLKGMELL